MSHTQQGHGRPAGASLPRIQAAIIAVGRQRAGPARDLFEAYRQRSRWPIRLIEVEERRPLPAAQRKDREGALLLGALPKSPGLRVIALDERGAALTSRAFAARLGGWAAAGMRETAFLIGGADGLAEAPLARAELVLSLGPMTWPHRLVPALLAEQLYRAQLILAGHPYHRD